MKRTFCLLAFGFLSIFTFQYLHAQDDQGAPPPPMDQDQGAPPPQGDQGAPPPPDQGGSGDQGDVSYQTFYDNLSDQGTWVQTDDYGYVFQPTVSDPDWAPYTNGHWAYTEWGWMWVSDEPWGWATYHYGRWANIDGYGWVWVPGYRWAPAWVSWRYGGGYCGWAPLPPETFIGVEFGGGAFGGYHFGNDVDARYHIGAGYYNFVQTGRMGDPNMRGAIVNRYNNYGIINRTTNVTNINVGTRGTRGAFGSVSTGGPSLATVNAHASTRIRTVNVTSSSTPGVSRMNGNSVSVFAPHVNGATARQGRPTSVGQTIAHPTFNRGTSISDPLAVNNRVRPTAPSQTQIERAQTAQAHAPASARIGTGGTGGFATPTHTTTANTERSFTPSASSGADSAFRGGEPSTTHTTAETYHSTEGNPASSEVNHASTSTLKKHHHTTTSSSYGGSGNSSFTGEAEHPAVQRETEAAPAVHHTETESTFRSSEAPVEHHESAAAPSYRSAEESHVSSAPHVESHAEAPHFSGGGGGNGGGHPSGGGGGGGKPSGGGGGDKDKKP